MWRSIKISICLASIVLSISKAQETGKTQNYWYYHQQIIEIEELIVEQKYDAALGLYEDLFTKYDFIFLRDYQVATQLALKIDQSEKAQKYLSMGVAAGWELKAIKKNDFLAPLTKGNFWKNLKRKHKKLKQDYAFPINEELKEKVKKMYSKDQWKAFGAIFRFSSKAQDRYAENKFAPHSEGQMEKLKEILKSHGYPGQKLIGNDFWMSTIISHHNSISENYNGQDSLYALIKPLLTQSLERGEISPDELALIEEWSYSTLNNGKTKYALLDAPDKENWESVNKARLEIGLRTIEVRNRLIDIQESTGMDFYLRQGWITGKIEPK